ncbi:hypothetical protein AMR72_05770 [Flavobacterium psychrophilum]|nr:hypothetical protein AMR72_05770 [Flavobacterium psychrophilum]AOE52070.1 hypothetical protein ALW18_05765 [Flavobacterium psychrophilum]
MKKRILFFTAILMFGIAKAQTTTCNGTEPGQNAGDTGCVAFTYNGESVQYATVRAADGNIWLQQNLGSTSVATSATDAEAYGDLYQWGRWNDGHQRRTSPTSDETPEPNNPAGLQTTAFLISDPAWWDEETEGQQWTAETPQAIDDLTGCDPCKAALGNGWRIPTEQEWGSIIESEGITDIATAYSSSLKLTVAGNRSGTNGTFSNVGARGYYWSSTQSTSNLSYAKYLYYSNAIVNESAGGFRDQGSSVRCIKGASSTPGPVLPTSLALNVANNAAAEITTDGGTLQLETTILPADASQNVMWNITAGNEFATLNSAGLVTATANGTVTVQAASSVNANILDSIEIIITNQVVVPVSIAIGVAENATAEITENNGTLQLTAAVLPAQTDQSVIWSITEEETEFATVSESGLVTAIADGTVTVQAVSTVDATVIDTIEITISNQLITPESIEITYEEDDSAIFYKDGSIQLYAKILPEEVNQEVVWSIINGSEFGSISADGLVTGTDDGIITVQAVSAEDDTVLETIQVRVKNQNLASSAPYCAAAVEYDVEPISHVVFAGINNASSAVVNETPAYEDFTDISGTVIKGQTYILGVQGNTVGLFEHDIRVFIDWNQDDVFDMDNEYYATSIQATNGVDGTEAILNITVPQDAVTGTTRLRITKDQWNLREAGAFDSCTNAYYGQVEDYSLIVNNFVAGLDDVNATQFTLYPNPTNDVVTVQENRDIQSIEVYNLTGQLIATGTAKQVNLGNAQAGVYMIKIHFENGSTATQKVIKK